MTMSFPLSSAAPDLPPLIVPIDEVTVLAEEKGKVIFNSLIVDEMEDTVAVAPVILKPPPVPAMVTGPGSIVVDVEIPGDARVIFTTTRIFPLVATGGVVI